MAKVKRRRKTGTRDAKGRGNDEGLWHFLNKQEGDEEEVQPSQKVKPEANEVREAAGQELSSAL